MTGVEFADSALDAVDGADACVIVTEWPEFAELDWVAVAERDARPARDRRAQLRSTRCGAGRGLHLRGHRALMPGRREPLTCRR